MLFCHGQEAGNASAQRLCAHGVPGLTIIAVFVCDLRTDELIWSFLEHGSYIFPLAHRFCSVAMLSPHLDGAEVKSLALPRAEREHGLRCRPRKHPFAQRRALYTANQLRILPFGNVLRRQAREFCEAAKVPGLFTLYCGIMFSVVLEVTVLCLTPRMTTEEFVARFVIRAGLQSSWKTDA